MEFNLSNFLVKHSTGSCDSTPTRASALPRNTWTTEQTRTLVVMTMTMKMKMKKTMKMKPAYMSPQNFGFHYLLLLHKQFPRLLIFEAWKLPQSEAVQQLRRESVVKSQEERELGEIAQPLGCQPFLFCYFWFGYLPPTNLALNLLNYSEGVGQFCMLGLVYIQVVLAKYP